MAFRCMNCNGHMVFDVATQQMKCEHCDSTCDPQYFVVRDTSPEAGGRAYVTDTGMALFTCQNCAATLEGTEDSMIGFCPYCGGQSLLKSEAENTDMERIIPFQVSKEQCVDLYRKYTSGVRYLPRELKDPEFINNFTGIYMPFFQYDATFGDVDVTGTKTVEHHSRYDVVNTYKVTGTIEGDYPRGVVYDGSKYLDDEISQRSLPYDPACEVPFNPAYLAGFYADTSTVPPERYLQEAAERAEEDMVGEVKAQVKGDKGVSIESSSSIPTTITGYHKAMHPLWFLTWRKDDRVAYAVINGQSGKVVSDLPLDLRTFAVGCGIISVVLFVLLELLVQPTPLVTSLVSLAGALGMAWGIRHGAEREFEQQTHANDLGWLDDDVEEGIDGSAPGGQGAAPGGADGSAPGGQGAAPGGADGSAPGAETKKRKKKKSSEGSGVIFLVVGGWIFFAVLYMVFKSGDSASVMLWLKFLLGATALIYTILTMVKILKWQKHVGRSTPTVSILILLATVLINLAIIIISPVNDGWYYLGDAVCILGLIASAIGMLRMYNISTTRPLPKLFGRQEV